MAAYYNEFDPFAAAWLRELIKAGHIAAGDVDQRSIVDVQAADLKGYTQCHFFAGIGGWSLALRLAMWGDDRPVWTGSCPCQPFSSAGKQKGHGDERHLWPHWARLIRECQPPIIFGEQVAGAVTFGWWDDVATELEAEGYACAAAVLPACSVGAPHKRDRLWFVGNAKYDGRYGGQVAGSIGAAVQHDPQGKNGTGKSTGAGEPHHVADSNSNDAGGRPREAGGEGEEVRLWGRLDPADVGFDVADAMRDGWAWGLPSSEQAGKPESTHDSDARWIFCPDGKARPIEPGLCLLAHGVSNRVGKLRGYGNAIVPQVAAEFIKAAM